MGSRVLTRGHAAVRGVPELVDVEAVEARLQAGDLAAHRGGTWGGARGRVSTSRVLAHSLHKQRGWTRRVCRGKRERQGSERDERECEAAKRRRARTGRLLREGDGASHACGAGQHHHRVVGGNHGERAAASGRASRTARRGELAGSERDARVHGERHLDGTRAL